MGDVLRARVLAREERDDISRATELNEGFLLQPLFREVVDATPKGVH